MTPKGGIRPHKRFSVQSNRSEVLFVDYMVEHLNPNGRAAIVVPEGVIFQNGTAYRKLRELLVKESLVGVISLPSGVFQPYSGVKTSILILDKHAAKSKQEVLFSEVRHIGVSLGIKRTITEHNDLPYVLHDFRSYYLGGELSAKSWTATREEILANEANLTGSRYRKTLIAGETKYVRLGDICSITKGEFSSTKTLAGDYPLIVTAADHLTANSFQFNGDAVCVPLISSTGHGRASIKRIHYVSGKFALANLLAALQPMSADDVNTKFVYLMLDSRKDAVAALMRGAANVSMKVEDLVDFQIPLPPLVVQEEIVAEIESYQKIIDGARQVVDNYQPRVVVQSDWPLLAIKDVAQVDSGFGFPLDLQGSKNKPYPFLKVSDMNLPGNESHITTQNHTVDASDLAKMKARIFPAGTVIFPKIGAAIATNKKRILTRESTFDNNVMGIVPDTSKLIPEYLLALLMSFDLSTWASDSQPPSMRKTTVEEHQIPVPDLDSQRAIAAEIEAEQALVNANRQLIECFESKVKAIINRVWDNVE